MKITIEDELHGRVTWEPVTEDFEISEVLQAMKGLLVTFGFHELVVNDAIAEMSEEIEDEYRKEDNTEVIDPVQSRYIDPMNPRTWEELYRDNPEKVKTMEELIAEKDDKLLNWPNDFDGAHSVKE